MATLDFQQQGEVYVAETVVHNDYNLHIERERPGTFRIYQRATASGMYKGCGLPYWLERTGQVIDHAFGHGVYPSCGLYLRIESSSAVTSATLTEAE